MNKKFAFTLTEVLITLSIVGVISAMTVPTLMNKYQREAQAVQIRKASQEFANAVDMYITSEGKTSLTATGIFAEDEDGNVPGIDSFIESNLRIVKKCDSSNPCFASSYRALDNRSKTFSCSGSQYALANSASICVTAVKGSTTTALLTNKVRPYLSVIMDTNGQEKPNIGGRDIFTFYITKNGELTGVCPDETVSLIEPQCVVNAVTGEVTCPVCDNSTTGAYCYTALEENNWKMNY